MRRGARARGWVIRETRKRKKYHVSQARRDASTSGEADSPSHLPRRLAEGESRLDEPIPRHAQTLTMLACENWASSMRSSCE